MLFRGKKISLFLSLLLIAGPLLHSQGKEAAELISEEYLHSGISFLAEDFCTGRASGSSGALEAANWVRRQFISAGLVPMDDDYVHTFVLKKSTPSALAASPRLQRLRYHALPQDSASFRLAVPPESLPEIPKPGLMFWKPQPKAVPVSMHARHANCFSRQVCPAPLDFQPQYDSTVNVRDIVCRNIMGFLPGKEDKYVIIAAHYDNLGILGGKMYPGADSNASGVAVLTALSRALSNRSAQAAYPMNIIFVALDAKQHSMAGSDALWDSIMSETLRNPVTGAPVSRKKIAMFINLDILGATDSPLHKERKDYLIMLSSEDVRQTSLLRWCNRMNDIYMDLAFDYYGSKSFTDMFLKRVSDQKVFIEGGVPSVMFTSGITMTTNKTEDTVQTIDFPVLRKRALLIYHWLDRAIWQF